METPFVRRATLMRFGRAVPSVIPGDAKDPEPTAGEAQSFEAIRMTEKDIF